MKITTGKFFKNCFKPQEPKRYISCSCYNSCSLSLHVYIQYINYLYTKRAIFTIIIFMFGKYFFIINSQSSTGFCNVVLRPVRRLATVYRCMLIPCMIMSEGLPRAFLSKD